MSAENWAPVSLPEEVLAKPWNLMNDKWPAADEKRTMASRGRWSRDQGGDPELTPMQAKAIESCLPEIRKAIQRYMQWYRRQAKP